MCGMTRAMICDPDMPRQGRGRPRSTTSAPASPATRPASAISTWAISISCIQHPETGRELAYGTRDAGSDAESDLVAGGGPGGMKAAAVAGRARPRRHALRGRRRSSAARRCWPSCCRAAPSSAASSPTSRARCELAGVRSVQRAGVDAALVRQREARCRRHRHRRRAAPARDSRARTRCPCGRCLAGAAGARPMSAPRSSSPTGAATGSAWAWPRSWRATAAACASASTAHVAGERMPWYVRDQLERHPAQARRRDHSLCAALRRRRRHRLPPARHQRRADHRERGRTRWCWLRATIAWRLSRPSLPILRAKSASSAMR